MSHWAKLENNIVTQVLVGNNNSPDEGLSLVQQLGGTWVKTSYNGNIKNKYAAVGDTYDSVRDIFIVPKPFPSWVEDENKPGYWKAPVEYPIQSTNAEQEPPTSIYEWDEDSVSWVELKETTNE